ncbi:MAG: dihydropteroate synthase [Desulfobacterales bacterium]|nr:dihydropteroate synthase [Desulfobacterales bacterium]
MFIIVGERINTSRKNVREAVSNRDKTYIQQDVEKQQDSGANYIDVNAGARIGHEAEDMQWLIKVIREVVKIPLCFDSPDPNILKMAYDLVDEPPMINSISLEKERLNRMLPFLKGKNCKIVALCMDDAGLPTSAQDVIDRAEKLVCSLEDIGMQRDAIFIDPLIQPVSTNTSNALTVLDAVQGIMRKFPGVHTICGLSNISYGLPQRKIINRSFLSLLMASGLDAAILDPLDLNLMAVLRTTEMLLGKDDFCARYLKGVRAGKIQA